jgi:hypothetical protein
MLTARGKTIGRLFGDFQVIVLMRNGGGRYSDPYNHREGEMWHSAWVNFILVGFKQEPTCIYSAHKSSSV